MNLQEVLSAVPDDPVDRYQVRYWRLSASEAWVYIDVLLVTYHVNTPWEKYDPKSPGGADLVDDWMVARNGSPDGRILGWKNIKKIPSPGFRQDTFATENEAIMEAIERLDDYIKKARNKIAELEGMRTEMFNRL